MRNVKQLLASMLFLAIIVLLGWVALWFYRGPDRVTQGIWEDAIVRIEPGGEPDWVGQHSRRGEHTGRCEWWALQTVDLEDVAPDSAEVLAASYERDGWDVTRMVSSLDGQFTVFAIKPDRSQRVTASFGPDVGVAISAAHDPGNCALLRLDQLNYDEELEPRVDSFPTS